MALSRRARSWSLNEPISTPTRRIAVGCRRGRKVGGGGGLRVRVWGLGFRVQVLGFISECAAPRSLG